MWLGNRSRDLCVTSRWLLGDFSGYLGVRSLLTWAWFTIRFSDPMANHWGNVQASYPSSHKTFVWHFYNVGPTSKPLGRRCIICHTDVWHLYNGGPTSKALGRRCIICHTNGWHIIQRWTNVEGVGPTLYNFFYNYFVFAGIKCSASVSYENKKLSPPRKYKPLPQCSFNVGQLSTTLDQHWANIRSRLCVCCQRGVTSQKYFA